MGANLLKEPRICLEKDEVTGLALYLFSLTLAEVAGMISAWEREGSPMIIDIDQFGRIFGHKSRRGLTDQLLNSIGGLVTTGPGTTSESNHKASSGGVITGLGFLPSGPNISKKGGNNQIHQIQNPSELIWLAPYLTIRDAFFTLDTETTGVCNAFELFCAAILLCRHYPDRYYEISESQSVKEKGLLLIEMFNFSDDLTRYVEVEIMFSTVMRSLRKVLPNHHFLRDINGQEEEERLLVNLWNANDLNFQALHSPQLSPLQFCEWLYSDYEARHLVEIFLYAFSLDDSLEEIGSMIEEQSYVFGLHSNLGVAGTLHAIATLQQQAEQALEGGASSKDGTGVGGLGGGGGVNKTQSGLNVQSSVVKTKTSNANLNTMSSPSHNVPVTGTQQQLLSQIANSNVTSKKNQVYWSLCELYPQYTTRLRQLFQKMAPMGSVPPQQFAFSNPPNVSLGGNPSSPKGGEFNNQNEFQADDVNMQSQSNLKGNISNVGTVTAVGSTVTTQTNNSGRNSKDSDNINQKAGTVNQQSGSSPGGPGSRSQNQTSPDKRNNQSTNNKSGVQNQQQQGNTSNIDNSENSFNQDVNVFSPDERVSLADYRRVLTQWDVFFAHSKHLLTCSHNVDAGHNDFHIEIQGIELKNLLLLKYGSVKAILMNKDVDIWCNKYVNLSSQWQTAMNNNLNEVNEVWDFTIRLDQWIDKMNQKM